VCGSGEPVVFWQPNLDRKRELLWLCARDRDRLATNGESVTLTWIWPGWKRSADDPVREVQPTRLPRGVRRLMREEAAAAEAVRAAEERMLLPAPRKPIDPETALRNLEAAMRNVDDTLARIAAQNLAFEEARRRRFQRTEIDEGLA
jgi:hypothetical protein